MPQDPIKLHFGGTFNPVHHAHLSCAIAAAVAGGFSELILVPTGQPALKDACYSLASAEDRLLMINLAILETPAPLAVSVEPIEITRPGPSFTFDTVSALQRRDGRAVHWLIGADQLYNLPRWHNFEGLMQAVQFWVMRRPGFAIDWARVHPLAQSLQNRLLAVPQIDFSATEIRRRVGTGESIDQMVTPNVREYIRRRCLYIP